MLLIILYGPPASGKQTVGKALSELTGFPLLHNHLIADLASSIFEYGTEEYVSLSKDLRIRALKAAIESDKPGIIMTFAYGLETKEGKDDDKILRHLQALVKRSKGKVIFIQLISERNTLVARVSSKSRKVHNKLTSKKILKHLLEKYRIENPIHFAYSLTIRTDELSPLQSAKKILSYIKQH